MATMTSPPGFFDSLIFEPGIMDAHGRRTDTAPCGCQRHVRMILDGRLAGHWQGDVRAEICSSHCQWCEECGLQTWPHLDCECPDEVIPIGMRWKDAGLSLPGEDLVDGGTWYAGVVQHDDGRWWCRIAWHYTTHPNFASLDEAKVYCQTVLDEYLGAGLDHCGLPLSR